MNGLSGRQGLAATFGQHCPQMTQSRCSAEDCSSLDPQRPWDLREQEVWFASKPADPVGHGSMGDPANPDQSIAGSGVETHQSESWDGTAADTSGGK